MPAAELWFLHVSLVWVDFGDFSDIITPLLWGEAITKLGKSGKDHCPKEQDICAEGFVLRFRNGDYWNKTASSLSLLVMIPILWLIHLLLDWGHRLNWKGQN